MKGSMTEVTDQTAYYMCVCSVRPLLQSFPLSVYKEGSVHVCVCVSESTVKANNIRYLTQKLLFLSLDIFLQDKKKKLFDMKLNSK